MCRQRPEPGPRHSVVFWVVTAARRGLHGRKLSLPPDRPAVPLRRAGALCLSLPSSR